MKTQREIFSSNLKRFLEEKNISQNEFARRIGSTSATVSRWITHTSYPRDTQIQKMADVLGVKMSQLTSDPNEIKVDTSNVIPSSEITTVPIIGTIACGIPIFSEENYIGSMTVPTKDVKGGEYFALRAKGDSMSPRIEDGDEVLIRRQPVAENGDTVAVSINGEITLKRYKSTDNGVMLIPDNKEYDPIILKEDNQNYIVGKAKKVSKKL